ncbi:hypothetical protein AB0869_16735 [Micromonospora vinacea]
MTDPRYVPLGLADAGRLIDDDGADVDLSHATRDGDPTGTADAEAER